MNKFTEIVNAICESGEWKVSYPEWGLTERNNVERQDGFYLALRVTNGNRLVVNNTSVKGEITISLSKPTHVIVCEVQKRFVQANESAWNQHLAVKGKERIHNEQQQANMKHFCDLAGVEKVPDASREHSFSAFRYSTSVSLRECRVNSDTVDLKLWFVPFDLAEKIILLIKGES